MKHQTSAFLILILTTPFWGQEPTPIQGAPQEQAPLSPAQEEAKKAAAERMENTGKPAAATITTIKVLGSGGNPVVAGAHLITGALTYQIQKAIATSTWSMNMTQKMAAKGIASFMTKQEGEPFEVSNSKVDGLIILTFSAKGLTEEKAGRIAKQEPMWKYKKTGWDRVVFTNGNEAWAWDTSVEIP